MTHRANGRAQARQRTAPNLSRIDRECPDLDGYSYSRLVSRLTHLARADHRSRILKAKIKPSRVDRTLAGVYAMPVLPNFYVSHQWLRELRRFHQGPLIAVDFVIPDDEEVLAGHYARPQETLGAAAAAALIMRADDPRGYQIFVPRAIQPNEIKRSRSVPQVVGCRYWPESHGKYPCACPLCLQPGTYGAGKIKRKLDEQARPTTSRSRLRRIRKRHFFTLPW